MKCTQCSREAEDPQYKTCMHCRESNREWKKANPEYMPTYREANRDKLNAQQREYRKANIDKIHDYEHRHYKENRKRILEYHREWARANPLKCKIQKDTRRARKEGNGGSYTPEQLRRLFDEQNGCCFYCGELLYASFDKVIHTEHKIPVSRGGTGYISNIALSCSRCNFEKGTKTHDEFLQARNA